MMKASYFIGPGQFKTLEEPIPELNSKDVLIKVAACGVCGTDVHIYQGDKGSAEVHPPVVLPGYTCPGCSPDCVRPDPPGFNDHSLFSGGKSTGSHSDANERRVHQGHD